MVSSNGVIWVTSGASLFRYEENEELEEYNFQRNSNLFPSKSHTIFNTIETLSGHVLVICSSNTYNGPRLEGGVLKWDEKNKVFERVNMENNPMMRKFWFMNSYTPISKNEAIIGTSSGFAFERNEGINDLRSLNVSYEKLFEDKKALFLGTKGVSIDNDLWLFGCASGVIAYNSVTESWFYPDKINWMLPQDVKYGNYGGRKVNAVEIDDIGRIYVGTDLGLLIYNPKGSSPTDFLVTNRGINQAFVYHNSKSLKEESDYILSKISKNLNSEKEIKEIKDLEFNMKNIDGLMDINKTNQILETKSVNIDSLTRVKQNLQKRHARELLKLEKRDPGLYQLLNIKPINLFSLRKNFKDNEVAVQYLPTKDKLFIHLVSKNKLLFREVDISKTSLDSLSISVSAKLANLAKYDQTTIEVIHKKEDKDLKEELILLYDVLLRPVKDEISDFENVYVVPFQGLLRVPFSSLINKISSQKMRYAVEDHNFGYLPSMYSYVLLLNQQKSLLDSYLLLGDPDGTLKYARNEVTEASKLFLNKKTFVGKEATSTNFKIHAPNSKVIHLATHAFLDKKDPSESYLLFADSKMRIPDIFNLSLNESEAVILSACETGKGASGMEFSTLARAFNNAGVSTVLATYWKVPDRSSKELIMSFYNSNSISYFKSLADSQRKMIHSTEKNYNHPSKWAGYFVIGKP